MNIQENYPLQKHNTFSLRQHARYFVQLNTLDDLKAALSLYADKKRQDSALEYLVIGDGSNIVFSRDYPGFIFKNVIKGIKVLYENDKKIELEIGAGENWHSLVRYTLDKHWFGLENLAFIPGTVGAAPVQNIGAYGVELRECVVSVQAWDCEAAALITLDKEACHFAYRDSVFKHQSHRYIITHVRLSLSKEPKVNIRYQALKDFFDQKQQQIITPQDVYDAVVEIRKSRLPDPTVLPNAGSFFKNPIIPRQQYSELLRQYPHLAAYPVEDKNKMKLAAAWLIDQAAWKGVREGNVAVHDQQALVLVNHGDANGQELLHFANKIQHDIKRRYHIDLDIEPLVV